MKFSFVVNRTPTFQGITTLRATGGTGTQAWRSITWSPTLGLWCAVIFGDRNPAFPYIRTSPDGINWTPHLSPDNVNNTSGYEHITWSEELGLFCIVGHGQIQTSPDGDVWTNRTTPVHGVDSQTEHYTGLVWSPDLSLFVGTRTSGGAISGGPYDVVYSSNGINWTGTTQPAGYSWYNVAWSPSLGLFVSVPSSVTQYLMTSSNGTTWALVDYTQGSGPASQGGWYGVAWSPLLGLFVAVATNGKTMRSSDGTNWIEGAMPNANGWTSIVWAPELAQFWACSQTGTGDRIAYSNNGIDWTAIDTTGKDRNWQEIEWSPSLMQLCVCAYSSDEFMTIE